MGIKIITDSTSDISQQDAEQLGVLVLPLTVRFGETEYEDGITIDTILEWLERFSYCFKASLEECIIELERGQQEALENMKAKETFPAFRRFCDKLMSIDNVGVAEAFDEIGTDRAYYIQKRQLDNKKMMDNKSAIAKMVCFAPLLYLIFLQLLLPFFSYAYGMWNIMSQMIQ